MAAFKHTKIIAGLSPLLAKETILSKIVNMVHVFKINLSDGFTDNNKKYIDTIMKLDHSKSIMLETKGVDFRGRNLVAIPLKKWDTINVDFSEYAQETDNRVYINYPHIEKLGEGFVIKFQQSGVELKITKILAEDNADCEVIVAGDVLPYDRVLLNDVDLDFPALTERDKKDILWGLENGVHMICLSNVNTKMDMIELKDFLIQNNKEDMKIIAKIENFNGLQNIDSIKEYSDGIILVVDKLEKEAKKLWITLDDVVIKLKQDGIPVIANYTTNISGKEYEFKNNKKVDKLCKLGIDAFSLETFINEDEVFDTILEISKTSSEYELNIENHIIQNYNEDSESIVRDYIIYNAYRVTEELKIKSIVCFSKNGDTPSKLVSFGPRIPIITFTKNEDVYRFMNLIRGVKAYKISPSFNYENLKKIGKEMIRIIFKGNISLDDIILIVQANEMKKDTYSDMINGIEVYKFKNI